jgi:hypothetical protein
MFKNIKILNKKINIRLRHCVKTLRRGHEGRSAEADCENTGCHAFRRISALNMVCAGRVKPHTF